MGKGFLTSYFKTLILVSLLLGGTVYAKGGGSGVLLGGNLFYDSQKVTITTDSETEVKSTETMTNFTLGYMMNNGLYLGAIYVADSFDNVTYKPVLSAMGASIGYISTHGFYVMGHYFISAEYKDPDSGSVGAKFNKGSGTEFDLGYAFNIAGGFYLGAQLSLSSITFKNYVAADGTESSNFSLKFDRTVPQLRLAYMF